MIYPGSTRHWLLSTVAAVALLVRIAIPTGYMPASVGDGWYLELCPDGMPTHVMVAMFGEHHAHHGGSSEQTFFECDYDSGAAGALIPGATFYTLSVIDAGSTCDAQDVTALSTRILLNFRSRAPPQLFRLA